MNYRNRIAAYQNRAERHFSNFGGRGGHNNLVDDFMPGGFRNFNGGAEVLDPNDRTLTVTVTNSDTTAKTGVRIFGSTKDLTDAQLPSGVTITVQESSHLEVKTELLQDQFRIMGLKYTVTTVAQFSNVLSLFEENSTGGLIKRIWQPQNYRSAQNQLDTQIDAPSFELLVTGKTYIEFSLRASEEVTFTFSISEKTVAKNILRNRPDKEIATVHAPTGLPQMDLRMVPGNGYGAM